MAVDSLPKVHNFSTSMCMYYGQEPGKVDTELIFLIYTEQF